MSEKIIRRLSVIMFTDIVGYTAMMRADEMSGFSKVKRYRKELDRLVNEHHGEILQHSEDGSLTIFTSAVEAIRCAYHLQLALKPQATGEEIIAEIPLRIGLHFGEVIIDGSDIYGNGIHVASRIGSLGQPGTVLFSPSIYEIISTYPEFKITALGTVQFKDVKGPFEAFALINEGLTVPDSSQEVQADQKGAKRKRWLRAMQMFAGYLVAAWTIVQFVDWILNRYQISPYWTDILLWLFVGVIPSLLIYLVNQDRIHQRILLQREKIIIPLNIFLLIGAITFAYGGVGLGSIDKNISFNDINGNTINQKIVKNEFRTSLLIFPFTQQKGADTTHWIGDALAECLMIDVTQDKYLNIQYHQAQEQVDKINSARLRDIEYYVDGSFSLLETGFEITPTVRDGRNGKVLKEKVFKGPDFFTLVDSISIYLRQVIGLKQAQIDESIDLNVSEYLTDNLEALKHFTKGSHDFDLASIEKAIELDTTFTLAMFRYALILDRGYKGKLEAKLYLERAMQYRKKLPLRYQVATMIFNYLMNDELEKAEKLINIQLELAPNDPMYLQMLSLLYMKGGQLDELAAILEQQFDRNPTPFHYIQVMNLALINGNPAQVEKDLLTLLKKFSNNEILLTLLMDAYMLQQKYGPAQVSLERIMLMNPDVEPMRSKMLDAINYLKENPIPTERLASLKGGYRSDGNERMMNFELFNKFLLRKTQNSNGYYLYPTSDTSFLRSFSTYINEYKPLVNEKNKVYGVLLHQTNLNGTTGDFYYWKQDSLIWRAEKLLKNRAYEQALPAYKAAITAYPEHYYLYKAKEHIEYMLSKPDSALQQLYQRYVGGYEGEWDIWIEDGQLFFKTPNIGRRILRPISDNEFIDLIDYNGVYTMDVENGEVKGIYGFVYDKDARDWRRLENWYRARKKLKD